MLSFFRNDCRKIGYIFSERHRGTEPQPMLESGRDAVDIHNFFDCRPQTHVTEEANQLSSQRCKQPAGSREERKAAAIYLFIMGIPNPN